MHNTDEEIHVMEKELEVVSFGQKRQYLKNHEIEVTNSVEQMKLPKDRDVVRKRIKRQNEKIAVTKDKVAEEKQQKQLDKQRKYSEPDIGMDYR